MISIRRYIQEFGSLPTDATGPAPSHVLVDLFASILDYIGVYVFAGEFTGLRLQLQPPKSRIHPDLTMPEAAEIDESVRASLSDYNRTAQETLQNTAIEMQQMVGVLGHALTVLSSGSERSVSRLRRIQDTLHRASTIQDISALRASLREAVQLIGEESSKERQSSAREREGIETQVVRFRELLAGNPNRRLQNREEGIRAISDSVATQMPGRRIWALVFVFDQLKAITQRYGPEAVDDLFLQLIRERLQPLAPSNTAFRWTESAIVAIAQLERDPEEIRSGMAGLNRTPLVCRVSLGNRTAVLRVGLSHMAVHFTGSPGKEPHSVATGLQTLSADSCLNRFIAEIDGFTGFTESE